MKKEENEYSEDIAVQWPTLEDLKNELRYQLTIENIDWDFFKDVVELAIEKDVEWLETLKEKENDLCSE